MLLETNALKEEYVSSGYQEETGIFKNVNLDYHALVVSQGWPSWSFAIEGLGFESISTLSYFRNITSRAEFLETGLGSTLINNLGLTKWLTKHNNDGVLFVQGDREFFGDILSKTDFVNSSFKLIYACNDQDFLTIEGFRVSHRQAGGVTDGEWTIHTARVEQPIIPFTKVVRNLSHVISTTEGPSSSKSLSTYGGKQLFVNGIVPWNNQYCQVRTTSVFTKDKLIDRLLSFREWMDIYDIELVTQDSLISLQKRLKVGKPSMSFISQIPIKVLRLVATSVFNSNSDASLSEIDNESLVSVDSDATCIITNLPFVNNDIESHSDYSINTSSLNGEVDLDSLRDLAAKPDDAEADPEDWDRWLVASFDAPTNTVPLVCNVEFDSSKHTPLFDAFRKLLIRLYRRNILRSLLRYLDRTHSTIQGKDYYYLHFGRPIRVSLWVKNRRRTSKKAGKMFDLLRDLEVGRDAVRRAAWSSWWNWDLGSTLYFWRWPSSVRQSIRDGTKLFVNWDLMPSYKKKPSWPKDERQREKMEGKLRKVREREYIKPGLVKSLTGFFAVPKAGSDIRIVYDATQCGLNDALWSPNFFMPTVDSILRNASSTTWFGDIDLGEMFLNYTLDLKLQPYAGIDVTELDKTVTGLGRPRVFERWTRTLMGFSPSPYICTQSFAWSEEIIVGNRLDYSNPFYWDKVVLNLPGTAEYDPKMSIVYKWNIIDQCLASFFGTYVDDIRSGGSTEDSCRSTTHRIGCRINYLGQQDAVRKRGHASKVPRPWAGARCIAIEDKGLYVLTTEEKWIKGQTIINKWLELLAHSEFKTLSYTEMEKDVGFLCHLSRTYPSTFPYLKGFYNSLNGWRVDRNKEGWKIGRTAWMELMSGDIHIESEESINSPFESRKRKYLDTHVVEKPDQVDPVPRFKRDLDSLLILFQNDSPPLRLVRGHAIGSAKFGFGDASGGGFGSSWQGRNGTPYRFGTWGEDMDGSSSNFRELKNLVDTLIEMEKEESLRGFEIFLFTDNSTAEAAFFNGSSSSEKLYELVLSLRKMEMDLGTKFHLCHVSGERMKIQGSDGLSRGNLNVGVMAGKDMLSFVPIHLKPTDRCDTIRGWVEGWTGEDKLEWLNEEGWFTRGHDLVEGKWELNVDNMQLPVFEPGFFVWEASPVTAVVMVEELRKARHKRQDSHHIVLIPRLMQPDWRKALHKAADLVISLPVGHVAWPRDMYEPLTIAFVFPFISHRPWQLRRSPLVLEMGRKLSSLWREDCTREGLVLRKLWGLQRELSQMSEELAWKVLYGKPSTGFSNSYPRKRRRGAMEKEDRGSSFLKRKKR